MNIENWDLEENEARTGLDTREGMRYEETDPSLEATTMASGLGLRDGAQTVRNTVRVWISLSFNMVSLYDSSSQFLASLHMVVWFGCGQLAGWVELCEISELSHWLTERWLVELKSNMDLPVWRK